jgi:hypothetical protein
VQSYTGDHALDDREIMLAAPVRVQKVGDEPKDLPSGLIAVLAPVRVAPAIDRRRSRLRPARWEKKGG